MLNVCTHSRWRWVTGLSILAFSIAVGACGTETDEPPATSSRLEPADCDPSLHYCTRPCFSESDCEDGHTCIDAKGNLVDGSTPPAAAPNSSPPPEDPGSEISMTNVDDAGVEDDAGIEDAGHMRDAGPPPAMDAGAQAPPGLCALACDTNRCRNPAHVCSSTEGFCRPGCDATRNNCDAPLICDVTTQQCKPEDGFCEGNDLSTCFGIPFQFHGRATRGCRDNSCRIDSVPVEPIPSFEADNPEVERISVQRPVAGQRIVDLSSSFVLRPRGTTIVATILEQTTTSLRSSAQRALWAAYLKAEDAAEVTVAQGGAMREGRWVPEAPMLPERTVLYFMAFGFDRGKLVASSDAIPFTFGPMLSDPGDRCGPEDLCDNDPGLLVCASERCRRVCLSDADCNVGACSPPLAEIGARVCL